MFKKTKAAVISPGKKKATVGAQQLTKIAPKILHSKGCFEAVYKTNAKIRTFALILSS
jgi:hypothetical protein